MHKAIELIPVGTTVLAVVFFMQIWPHYRIRRSPWLFWWAIGVACFGLGTLSESIHAIRGWSETNQRFWYIIGALLGGFPLAQGTVYLHMKRGFADISAICVVSIAAVASLNVLLSPVSLPPDFDYNLSGKVFEWTWVRYFSPVINLYALLFLVGGAIWSARQYYFINNRKAHFRGNILIAMGGLLPGIGGAFTRIGHIEVLYITELIGLLLIFLGYRVIKKENLAIA